MTCLVCGEPLTAVTGCRVHPTCDTNPDALVSEAFALIEKAITDQPRSQQTRIGPSEIGVPCDRRLAYKLAGVPEVNDRGVPWKPYVGTAMHEQIGNVLARHEITRFQDPAATTRHHIEERVSVGVVNGVEVTGSCDWFDEWPGAVWDWKFTTRNKIREIYRPHGPGDQYRIQAHLYGRGWQRAGHDVRTVGVIFMTRDGEFSDRHVWWEPYDEQIAIDALTRLEGISLAVEHLDLDFALASLPTANAYCNFCSWHKPNSSDLARGCPGHPKVPVEPKSLAEMLR